MPGKVSMPVMVRFNYTTKDDNFLGTAEIPTPTGRTVKFETIMPLSEIRDEVKKFLETIPPTIAGDPRILGNVGFISRSVAKMRARRRLGTAIKMRVGGTIRPYEIAGPAGHAVSLAQRAANKRYAASQYGYDVGFLGLGKVARAIGRGTKAVGKGIGKGAKAVGKGTVKGGKLAFKGGKAVVQSPLGLMALSAVPGGAGVIKAIDIAKGAYGKKSPDGSGLAVKPESMRTAKATPAPAPASTSSNGPIIAAVLGGGALLMLLAKRR